MYALIKDGAVVTYPYGINNLRQDNPNTSFPASMPDESLAEWGVYPVQSVLRPNLDYTKNVMEGALKKVKGKWTQVWEVSDASEEEIAVRTAERAVSVRAERGLMLSACDWTQVDDTPMTNTKKQEWAVYRQALRDISTQTEFPWNVVWPIPPT